MTYQIAFKILPCETFPEGVSDVIGCDYKTVSAAESDIAEILHGDRSDLVNEMKDAAMWVVDENGNAM